MLLHVGLDEVLVAVVGNRLEAYSFRMKLAWKSLRRSVSEISPRNTTDLDLPPQVYRKLRQTYHAGQLKASQACQSIPQNRRCRAVS